LAPGATLCFEDVVAVLPAVVTVLLATKVAFPFREASLSMTVVALLSPAASPWERFIRRQSPDMGPITIIIIKAPKPSHSQLI